jgi:hypothetical protein
MGRCGHNTPTLIAHQHFASLFLGLPGDIAFRPHSDFRPIKNDTSENKKYNT